MQGYEVKMEMAVYELNGAVQLFKIVNGDAGAKLKGNSESSADQEDDAALQPVILCRYCRNNITSHEQRIAVNGSHNHRRFNPVGVIFDVGCFSHAPGCYQQSEPTLEHTWFPGYSWSYALCANCHAHLGWFFESGAGHDGFVGLILDKLIEPI